MKVIGFMEEQYKYLDWKARPMLHLDEEGAYCACDFLGAQEQAKPLKGFGSAGVLEVVENWHGNTYRAVYTVKLAGVVYVLHCFQKKSVRGIATPKPDMDVFKDRLKMLGRKRKDQTNEKH